MNLRVSLLIWMIVGFIGLSLTAESSLADVADEKKDKHGELQPVVRTLSTTEKNSRESEADYEDEDEEEDGEPEGREHVDEYEEELRSMAESHEAMSRDEKSNSSDSLANPPEAGFNPGMVSSRNFDSQEKNLEESSDESMTSNEAISGEVTGPAQELLKFKRQASGKIKRVPTVKKELSLQIRLQGNDTNEDAVKDELLGKKIPTPRQIIDNHLLDDDGINPGPEESYLERSLDVDGEKERAPEDSEEYMDLDAPTEILGKLDKRQQSDLKGLETYLEPATHTYELEKLAKLEELRAEEYILAENLMELLVKLAENPKRWERTHKLLRDMENDLELWRASDSSKRGYDFRQALSQPDFPVPVAEKLKPPTEKPKKKKKKKKKPRSQLSTETPSTTSSPSSPITPSTTPAPTAAPKTPASTAATHWRIFPELFGSPVRNSLQKEPSNLAKIHYAVGKYQKPFVGLSNRNTDTDDTSSGYLNDQVPGILDSSHVSANANSNSKYPLSRKFHFGKINTHEKDSPLNQHDSQPSIYEPERDRASPRLLDYPLGGRAYHHEHQEPSRARVSDRFDRYRPPYVGERVRNQIFKDYQEPAGYPGEFPRQAPYAKSWKYSKYDLSPPVDPYYEDERSNWATRYRAWQTFWRPIFEIEDADEAKRRMLFGKFSPSSYSSSSSSSLGSLFGAKSDKTMQIPWRSIDDSSRSKSYNREPPVSDKTRNHSEFNEALKSSKEIKDENVALPKITMKTWNSLTSDPATWPFKLSDAKPWPKDKNGKSYNPNADLVRKLGLDKQERLLDKDEDKKTLNKEGVKDNANLNLNGSGKIKEGSNPWTSDRKMWPIKMSPKIQSVGAWVMPADDAGWSSFNQQHFEDPDWQLKGKLTKWNVEFAKPVPDSPPKWKQFSYHKINTKPISKSGATPEESARRNAFIAVSAVAPSKYPGNEWRKNDIEENFGDNPLRTAGDIDRDDPSTQLLHNHWQQQTQVARPTDRRNLTDPLEYQLEELRLNNIEKRSAPTQATYMSSTLNSTAAATASTTRADLEKSTKVAPKIEKFPSKPIKE